MSKVCPYYGLVLYLDCLECEEKYCRGNRMANPKEELEKLVDDIVGNVIVVGIDQSYKDTGISISYRGKLMTATHCYLDKEKDNCAKRRKLKLFLYEVFEKVEEKKRKTNAIVIVIIERIRLHSDGFVNINYIKAIGALNAMIVDTAAGYDYQVYSVDTRAWKSAVVGTSKEKQNKYGIDPKKFLTIIWCIKQGYKKYIIDYDVGKKKKGVIEKDGEKYFYNDNIADSICISLYGFAKGQSLELEH